MTRINTIDVSLLADQHLVAEYRELPMIMGYMRHTYDKRCSAPYIPANYRMGRGHMNFFVNKKSYLYARYNALVKEMLVRNFKPAQGRLVDWGIFAPFSMRHGIELVDWEPVMADHLISAKRIATRLREKQGFYRMHGQIIISMEAFVQQMYSGI